MELFAVCPPGLENVLDGELRRLGLPSRTVGGGVETTGDPRVLNLRLRTASRVLVRLGEMQATSFAELVRKATALPFEKCLRAGEPVALRVTCRKSRLYHSAAVAQRLREAIGKRLGKDAPEAAAPGDDCDEASAQLLVARFDHDVCTVSADTSGALLHRRGYRIAIGAAPLRETLAAAMLIAAEYDPAQPLLDPLCGSGTIPIEAALIARRRAPGLLRSFAFERWPEHDSASWRALRDTARAEELPRAPASIVGSDSDARAIAAARENAARAGVRDDVRFEVRDLRSARGEGGLVATNPPYGVRLAANVAALHRDLIDLTRASRARLTVLAADARAIPGRALFKTHNGGVPVRLVAGSPYPL
jgi:putative N6-adenine-specific DNA methylase